MSEPLRPLPVPLRPKEGAERLESWKEIAAYLRREVRTVQGWEKSEGLPVHRHQHSRQGTVYAFKSELEAWRQARQAGSGPGPLTGLVALTPRTRQPARPTVGRQKEQRELQAALEHVAAGRGLMLCVTGEPGMGKTTLVEEFLDESSERCRVARGKCSERLAGTEAYLPWVESLESLLRQDQSQAIARLMKTTAPNWYGHVV
jgi:ATP-dependent Clp protease ATP-binding subunit ClpA